MLPEGFQALDDAKTKQMALIIIPIISGTLSLLGSSSIVYKITQRERSHWTMFHRMMLSMSLIDIVVSFNFAITTLPVNTNDLPINVWGAHGNQVTCSISGFFLNFFHSVSIYNVFLLIYFTLYLTNKQSIIQLKWIEVFFHLFAVLYPLFTGLYSVINGYFNTVPTLNCCYIAPYPPLCNTSGEIECTRGPPPDWLSRAMMIWPQCITLGIFLLCFTVISFKIYVTERNMTNDLTLTSTGVVVVNNYIREVAIQSLLYALTFINTFVWGTVPYAILMSKEFDESIYLCLNQLYPYVLLGSIFLPLQGFSNLIIYCGPRYRRIRRLRPGQCFLGVCKESVFGPSLLHRDNNNNDYHNNNFSRNNNESHFSTVRGAIGQQQIMASAISFPNSTIITSENADDKQEDNVGKPDVPEEAASKQ